MDGKSRSVLAGFFEAVFGTDRLCPSALGVVGHWLQCGTVLVFRVRQERRG